jgi:hypothetical protein
MHCLSIEARGLYLIIQRLATLADAPDGHRAGRIGSFARGQVQRQANELSHIQYVTVSAAGFESGGSVEFFVLYQ